MARISDKIIFKAALKTYRSHLVGLETEEPSILQLIDRVKELQQEKWDVIEKK